METYRGLEHYLPSETAMAHDRHVLLLKGEGGEKIGEAIFMELNEPFPICYLDELRTTQNHREQKKGYGSQILDTFNAYLLEQGKAGFLSNSIDPSSPASGMYERHGWKPTPIFSWLTYNLPENLDNNGLYEIITKIRRARSMDGTQKSTELDQAA